LAKGSLAIGIIFLGVGVFVCQQAFLLSLGNASHPGPGFMAFGLGLILVILSIIYLFQGFHKDKPQIDSKQGRPMHVLAAFLILSFVTAVLNWLGYLLSTFFLFLIWLILIERKKLILSFGISILALIFIYFFNLLFSIQLPKGLIKGF